jgi:transcriptional regulator with XRE-family HTH domain
MFYRVCKSNVRLKRWIKQDPWTKNKTFVFLGYLNPVMIINDNIKLIRELSGKTQLEFAKVINTNISNIKSYESGKTGPKTPVKLEICRIGGVSLGDLETKKLQPEDIKIDFDRKKVEKDVPTVNRETSETAVIPPQAWQNLSESILHLSRGIEKGQGNIESLTELLKSNSDDSSDIYSEDEVEALIDVLGRELAGKKVEGAAKFAAYAKKKLAEIRFGAAKGNVPEAPPARNHLAEEQ